MSPEFVVSLLSQSIWLIIKFVAVLVLPSLVVGLIVAVFQAATQVNEQTLSFLPRLLTTLLTIIFVGNWMITEISDLFRYLFLNIPHIIG
ncbi:flagellar biosynthetic protein FliQ [Psychromonas ingrahamii 37]|uniref:Flagellar biosynthetic protein FliQ n=1 Tax=Psychromonas ingrahamii (strain DSM 17664 / CCUG 51855 / 37) TaxID=357804 RepID=A1T0L2_PSYIN|nr:flagellar biosynthesis protein FliQ [Psychromonas ingrahamii]ABM05277.1 flagellar biosynthetic protein FliQ [Psychromonas ingrahamii 37]